MKFSDVCKAFVRYWYVILVIVILALTLTLTLGTNKADWTAKSTVIVKKSDDASKDAVISSEFVYSDVFKECSKRMHHNDFLMVLKSEITASDKALGDSLSVECLGQNIKLVCEKDTKFFDIQFSHKDKTKAKLVADIATNMIIDEYNKTTTTYAVLDQMYSTQVDKNADKLPMYSVIGILVGLALGVVVVTFFVVFNPFVESKELLEVKSGVNVLQVLDKVGGEEL